MGKEEWKDEKWINQIRKESKGKFMSKLTRKNTLELQTMGLCVWDFFGLIKSKKYNNNNNKVFWGQNSHK